MTDEEITAKANAAFEEMMKDAITLNGVTYVPVLSVRHLTSVMLSI